MSCRRSVRVLLFGGRLAVVPVQLTFPGRLTPPLTPSPAAAIVPRLPCTDSFPLPANAPRPYPGNRARDASGLVVRWRPMRRGTHRIRDDDGAGVQDGFTFTSAALPWSGATQTPDASPPTRAPVPPIASGVCTAAGCPVTGSTPTR